jgi:hypothetical protein
VSTFVLIPAGSPFIVDASRRIIRTNGRILVIDGLLVRLVLFGVIRDRSHRSGRFERPGCGFLRPILDCRILVVLSTRAATGAQRR